MKCEECKDFLEMGYIKDRDWYGGMCGKLSSEKGQLVFIRSDSECLTAKMERFIGKTLFGGINAKNYRQTKNN